MATRSPTFTPAARNDRRICRSTRHQDVRSYSGPGEISSHDRSMRLKARLRSAVTGHSGTQHGIKAGRNADDAPPFALHHAFDHCNDKPIGRDRINFEESPRVFFAVLPEAHRICDEVTPDDPGPYARVIDEHVHRTQTFNSGAQHTVNLGRACEIGGQDGGARAKPLNLFGDWRQRGFTDVCEGHLRAGIQQGQGHCAAEPSRGARHEGYFSIELHVTFPLTRRDENRRRPAANSPYTYQILPKMRMATMRLGRPPLMAGAATTCRHRQR